VVHFFAPGGQEEGEANFESLDERMEAKVGLGEKVRTSSAVVLGLTLSW
jgi:hypothetical protein